MFFNSFDYHSRKMQGLSIADGTSVLLKFCKVSWDWLLYSSGNTQQSYFHAKYLNVDRFMYVITTSSLSILSHYQRAHWRLDYQNK